MRCKIKRIFNYAKYIIKNNDEFRLRVQG
jgi:hypothetical protein